jgi:DNA-binding response OmpR family regulator
VLTGSSLSEIGDRIRLLIVEGDQDLSEMLTVVLENVGYRPRCVQTRAWCLVNSSQPWAMASGKQLRARARGFDEYLTKPLQTHAVLAALARCTVRG